MFIAKVILLVLALICFLVDTVGITGIEGSRSRIVFRPLGLAFWTMYWMLQLLVR
jgi:hypothetical protein